MNAGFLNEVDRIVAQMVREEPSELRGYLAAISPDRAMHRGTTAPAVQPRFGTRPSGLLVPQQHAHSSAPIDAMYHYLTAKEVLGFVPEPSEVGEHLRRVALPDVLLKLAIILAALRAPGADRREVDVRFANELAEPFRTRVLNNLRDPSATFIAPQAWFALAKLACHVSGDALSPGTLPGDLHYAALVMAQHLGTGLDTTELVVGADPAPFSRELIANQVFNAKPSEAHLLARFARRWMEMPDERSDDPLVVPLREVFEEVTGVPLPDFMMIGAGLWAASCGGTPHVLPGYFDSLGLSSTQQDEALAIITVDVPTFRALVTKETREFGLEWAVSTFSQYPVVRLYDGSLLVLDPALVLQRVFGWLPLFDITSRLKNRGEAGRKRANQVFGCVQHLSELYAHEVLASALAGGPVTRLYDSDDLLNAFGGPGRRVADAAVDYGDGWVVAETTTSQLGRKAVAGLDDETLVKDLDKLVGEVEQIDSTIRSLRDSESVLTALPATDGRRFTPVLVVAEGFPVNPVSLANLRERVAAKGFLAGTDTDPLEVLDIEELEMVEALQESGGPNLRDLLRAKQASNFHHDSLRNYVIFEVSDQLRHPRRLNKLWEQVFKPTFDRLLANAAA